MIQINHSEDCCGCTACACVCSHNAISMESDPLGFKYPIVDTDKCIECGLCEKVCAFNANYNTELNLSEPIALGARHNNIQDIMKSRSGAIFVAISDYILKRNGIVYGVGFNEHFVVSHKRATTKFERDEFRCSKYVQSDLSDIFISIRQDLKDGKEVMFVGTACQTAGLNSFIGKKFRSKLLLVDIVCHGTPGPKIWEDYVSYLETRYQSKLSNVNFRDKVRFGWTSHRETFEFENGVQISPDVSFYKHLFFRKSCGICYYCNTRRPSDITIADFWGWEKQNPEINMDNKGINLVLINTEKGINIFESIKEKIIYFKAHKEAYLQPNLRHSTPNHPFRDIFERDYIARGFEYAFFHDYNKPTLIDRIQRIFFKYIRRPK